MNRWLRTTARVAVVASLGLAVSLYAILTAPGQISGGSPQRTVIPLEKPGEFVVGCNYWASHAGIGMWSNWRPEIVDRDFARLEANGIQVIRVFPIWSDFQPISMLRGAFGRPIEMRIGEEPLPNDEPGQAGVSPVMLGRLDEMCALAERHHLRLIVGLVTGWMSGRLFVPEALEGRNPITDPTSLVWQIKYVRALVGHERTSPAIIAWDLGNECNVMGDATSRDAAYLWTASIANAIRAADGSRPIVSGMHTLSSAVSNVQNWWTIDDQAELTDILTTHPYPYWTRYMRSDVVDSFRTTMHATAETRLYGDIGGKPCFAEEIGTMGPMVASDDVSAEFARVNLYSLWANDCRGFLWWCAFDQSGITQAPYDWNAVELELGLMRRDGSPKPVLQEITSFRKFLGTLPFQSLPVRRTEAVCLLTHGQDDWAVAFGTYALAKQAKLEVAFRHIEQPLPAADIYLLPSISGANCVPQRRWQELLERVRNGAVLYVSLGSGILPNFNEVAGVQLISRAERHHDSEAVLLDGSGTVLPLKWGDDLTIAAKGCAVLASRKSDESAVFWEHQYGKGRVIGLACPIEAGLTESGAGFDRGAPSYWRVYQAVAKYRRSPRLFEVVAPHVAITEHHLSEKDVIIVAINQSSAPCAADGTLLSKAELGSVWRGDVHLKDGQLLLNIPPFEAAVFELRRN